MRRSIALAFFATVALLLGGCETAKSIIGQSDLNPPQKAAALSMEYTATANAAASVIEKDLLPPSVLKPALVADDVANSYRESAMDAASEWLAANNAAEASDDPEVEANLAVKTTAFDAIYKKAVEAIADFGRWIKPEATAAAVQ
jgi:hypothetical protein